MLLKKENLVMNLANEWHTDTKPKPFVLNSDQEFDFYYIIWTLIHSKFSTLGKSLAIVTTL